MGLDNRDYARENFSSDRGGWGPTNRSGNFRDWEVWKKLIAANIVVFLLQIFVTRPMTVDEYYALIDRHSPQDTELPKNISDSDKENTKSAKDSSKSENSKNATDSSKDDQSRIPLDGLEENLRHLPRVSIIQKWCELDSKKVLSGQVWRLVTCGFCHSRYSFWHLLMNMLFLFWFGRRLELIYGSREFTALYFAAMLTASFAYIGLDLYTGTLVPAIGASGAVWGIVAIYAMKFPYERIFIYFLFPIQIRILALIYFLFDLHPVLLALAGDRNSSGVAHAAHVGGAVFGFLYWKYQWRLMPIIYRLIGKKPRWANARPRQHREEDRATILKFPDKGNRLDGADSDKMDAILEKLSANGRESLEEDELEFLKQMSQRLRDD